MSAKMTPSRELSEAVMLAVAFAERGSLPERPARIVTAKVKRRRFTGDDFTRLGPHVLAGLAELFAIVDGPGNTNKGGIK